MCTEAPCLLPNNRDIAPLDVFQGAVLGDETVGVFGEYAVARCASLPDESMLLSLHAPKSRTAHGSPFALMMSKVGSSDVP